MDGESDVSLFNKVYKRYSENGLSDLLNNVFPYLTLQLVRRQTAPMKQILAKSSNNSEIWYGDQEFQINITSPEHPELQQAFEEYPMEFNPERGFVCEVSNIHLVGDNAVAIHQGRNIIKETTGGWALLETPRIKIIKDAIESQIFDVPTYSDDGLFPLYCPDESYYHWMVEFLPKLRFLELYKRHTEKDPTLLIESSPRKFVKETLDCAGYNTNDCLQWSGGPLEVENLIVSTHRHHNFNYDNPSLSEYTLSYQDINWVRKRMRESLPKEITGSTPTRRIYVSRQDTDRGRKIINFDKTMDVLRQYGFKEHTLEEYSFSKQLRLFAEADIIAGPHGAGLLNLIFADNPIVLEFFPDSVIKPHFYFLSDMYNFNYKAVVFEEQNDNIFVDTKKLDNVIYQMVNST